jgi:fructuronate reductase
MVDGRYFFTTSAILVGVVNRHCRSGKRAAVDHSFLYLTSLNHGKPVITGESDASSVRSRQPEARIVHLGFGAFHRAHQAVYTDILAAEHGSDWGYCEVNLIGGEQQIADLKAQDNLYTVAEMSADAWTSRVVGVVKKALHAQVDGLEAVLAAMCEPQVAIVSLTITEKGYCHSPATGKLMLDHPLIAADLQNPHQPKSAPGVVVEALARRKAAGLPAFSVMSCDNMPENGHVMRNVTCAYARALTANWRTGLKPTTFPSTMVDRIVPAVTAETLDKIEQLTAYAIRRGGL